MKALTLILLGVILTLLSLQVSNRNRDAIVFFGDSITNDGAAPGGFIHLIKEKLPSTSNYLFVNAGVPGNTVQSLLNRIEEDVLEINPKIVVVQIGVNDVFLPDASSATVGEFKVRLKTVLERIRGAGASAIICTPTIVGESRRPATKEDKLLEEYAESARQLSQELDIKLCDLRAAYLKYLEMHNKDNMPQGVLTSDGVHSNEQGNKLIAETILPVLKLAS